MIFTEIAAFFAAVCTPMSGQPTAECMDWMFSCWVEQLETGREAWHGAEVCSELLPPDLVK